MARKQAINTDDEAQIEDYLKQIDEGDWYRIFRASKEIREIDGYTSAYAMAFALADAEVGPETPSDAYAVIKKEAKGGRYSIYQYGWPPSPGVIGIYPRTGEDYI